MELGLAQHDCELGFGFESCGLFLAESCGLGFLAFILTCSGGSLWRAARVAPTRRKPRIRHDSADKVLLMPHAPTSMLSHLENGLVSGQPVADLLRNLIVLGGRADSSELVTWASKELRGYGAEDALPDYRTLNAVIQVDYFIGNAQVTGQTVGPEWFPEEIRQDMTSYIHLRQGIGEIQSMVDGAGPENPGKSFLQPGSTALSKLIYLRSGKKTRVTQIYWTLDSTALAGLLDQVKTRLAELMVELRAATPRDADLPTAAAAGNAVNIVINGRGNSVSVANATGESQKRPSDLTAGKGERRFWTLGKRIGAFAVGLATVLGTLITWWQSHL